MKLSLWQLQGWLYETLFLLKPHAALVTDVAQRLDPTALVLDAGCGTGRLGMDTSAHVVGVDFSGSMLRKAVRRLDGAIRGSLTDSLLFPDNMFDQVTNINVLYALGKGYPQALAELYRVTKPGGMLFLANPVSEDLLPLVREHFRTASRGEILRSIVSLPRFIAWMVNLAIRSHFTSSEFLYLEEPDLVEAIENAGFSIVSIEPAYAGIDRLVIARKD